jgi:phosphoribosylaminoimidazole carboxylase PurE protein
MSSSKSPLIGIVCGSDSDLPTIESAVKLLKEFGVGYELRILSAHRTPQELSDYCQSAPKKGIKVFITAAGMSAALPGVVAAHTILPVIGIPVASGSLQGIDALLAISQMPPGVPVATVSIGIAGAKNAAVLAIRILALSDPSLDEKLRSFVQKQREEVLNKDRQAQTSHSSV